MDDTDKLDAIYREIVVRKWSPRKVPLGVYLDELRGVVVVNTVQLLDQERDALRELGRDRIEVDETADPKRR